jgi:AbrB family looped-hinge helix DNA binding protein
MKVDADDGRIYLPKETRDRMGTKFELIDRGDKIVLIPIPKEPLETLQEEWSEVEKTVEELKEGAMEEAVKQAGR